MVNLLLVHETNCSYIHIHQGKYILAKQSAATWRRLTCGTYELLFLTLPLDSYVTHDYINSITLLVTQLQVKTHNTHFSNINITQLVN